MRVLVFSDIHLDAVTAGRERLSEVRSFLTEAWHVAEKNKVDVVIFAGDAHDPASMHDALYTSELLRMLATYVRAPWNPIMVLVAGNHDVVDTSELFLGSPITTLSPLRAAMALLPPDQTEKVHIFDRPFTRKITNEWAVLGLPYISRAHSASIEVWDHHAFECAREYAGKGMKLIVAGHRVVPGAAISSETTEMARGQDQLFPVERVAALSPALVINGHYHARQVVQVGGLDVHIPGSPLSFTFGEADEVAKGVLLAEFE